MSCNKCAIFACSLLISYFVYINADLNSYENHINDIKKSSQDINADIDTFKGFYFPQNAACRCENGKCEKEGETEVCKCPPLFGNYSKIKCRACDCGLDANCIYTTAYSYTSKICLCPPEYGDQGGKCVDCNCGPNSNCTWTKKSSKIFTKECHCKQGYHDEQGVCVGPCSNNPCKNGGTCKDADNGYECICPSQYKGKKDCSVEISPCSSNPCKNGGNCKDSGNSFTCDCVKPYKGPTCETSKNIA